MEEYIFSRIENRIRLQWLCLLIMRVGFFFVSPHIVRYFDPSNSYFSFHGCIHEMFATDPSSMSMGVIFSCFYIYLAYNMQGTMLLTLYLISTPFFLLLSITFFLLPDVSWIFRESKSLFTLGAFFLGNALSIWWYILSLKLIKINSKVRELRKLHVFEDKSEIFSLFLKVQTLENLEWEYSNAIKKYPQFETLITNEYKIRKKDLLQPS